MRELKFRAFDKRFKKMDFGGGDLLLRINSDDFSEPMQFTGLQDCKENDIYEGDILSDWTETDEGKIQSKEQVFWNEFTGSWHLDNSYEQDKTCSRELWQELNDFKYEITSNIYEK
ncbi:YopX family protein [Tenacibaculum sp.]|uniref:YopX family protein n=1 Tax=Tenacibaculum sp. TaxID=1906242 RepID=UPI003D1045D2